MGHVFDQAGKAFKLLRCGAVAQPERLCVANRMLARCASVASEGRVTPAYAARRPKNQDGAFAESFGSNNSYMPRNTGSAIITCSRSFSHARSSAQDASSSARSAAWYGCNFAYAASTPPRSRLNWRTSLAFLRLRLAAATFRRDRMPFVALPPRVARPDLRFQAEIASVAVA